MKLIYIDCYINTEWFSYSTFIIKVFREYAIYKLDQEYAKNLITPKHIDKLLKSNDKNV